MQNLKQKTQKHCLTTESNSVALCLLVALVASVSLLQSTAQAGQRPITDFTSRQGTYCLQFDVNGNVDCTASTYGGSGCQLFVPPQPNVNGWANYPCRNEFRTRKPQHRASFAPEQSAARTGASQFTESWQSKLATGRFSHLFRACRHI
jgi:hypothetical protein